MPSLKKCEIKPEEREPQNLQRVSQGFITDEMIHETILKLHSPAKEAKRRRPTDFFEKPKFPILVLHTLSRAIE